MPRVFIPAERIKDEGILLRPKEARYISKVLRLDPGDEVTVFDGEGREYLTELCEDYLRGAHLAVKETLNPQRESPLKLTIGQGLLKGDKMKFVIQKATELGAHVIVPLVTSRSVLLLEGERESLRVQRWRKIAQEAAKQCGRTVVPQVETVRELEEFFLQREGT